MLYDRISHIFYFSVLRPKNSLHVQSLYSGVMRFGTQPFPSPGLMEVMRSLWKLSGDETGFLYCMHNTAAPGQYVQYQRLLSTG